MDSQHSEPPAGAPRAGTSPSPAWVASEDLTRAVLDNATDIIYTLDLEGRFVFINRAGERLLGYSAGELQAMSVHDLAAPETGDLTRRMLRRKLEGEEQTLYELEVVARDGRRIPLEVNSRLVHREGVPVGVQAVARDVSDRRRAEDALRHGEERFRILVENASEGICLLAPDGVIFYASRPASRILGSGLQDLVGRQAVDMVHEEDRERLAWIVADCLSKPGIPVHADCRVRHREGTWRHIEGVGVNRLDHPALGAIVINFRDVTERREAIRALKESEERFRAVFESSMLGIAHVDPAGRILDANPAIARISGYAIEDLRGRRMTDFAHPDDLEAVKGDFSTLLRGESDTYRAERRYTVRDGTVLWADVSASAVRDEHGNLRFTIVMLENITERKRAERDLVETNERLSVWVEELEQRTREITLLGELGELLQACRTTSEAYGVVGPMAAQMFPRTGGVLAVVTEDGTALEAVASWGGAMLPAPSAIDDCWAIRRSRVHVVTNVVDGLVCRHLADWIDRPYLCVPIMAHGELIGLFTVFFEGVGGKIENQRRLAVTVGEHIGLAVANLRLQETLRSQSIRDPLTGLFNRRYMEESLEREMRRAARGQQPVGIIMVDLDHFKDFNDRHGHGAGDALLQAVGQLLQRSIRAEDIACRYGGEEFTLILPDASLAEARQRAEYLCDLARRLTFAYAGQTLGPVSMSAGVAIFPNHGPTADTVLRAADLALYSAKAEGRNRVVVSRAGALLLGEEAVTPQLREFDE